MDFSPGRRILARYWPVIIALGVLTAVVAFGASYLVSPVFSANSHVLVHQAETRLLTTTGQDLKGQPGGIDPVVAKSVIQTDAGLVNSRGVAEHVVQQLHLDQARPQDSSLVGQLRKRFKDLYHVVLAFMQYGFYAEPDPYLGAVSTVTQQLEGTPIKDSYLIEIKARTDEPELAAAMANTAADALITVSQQRLQRDGDQYRVFLQSELNRTNADVQSAEAALQDFQEKNGITDIAEQTRLSANDESQARKVLADTDAALEEAKARYADLQNTLSQLSETQTQTNRTVISNASDAPQSVTQTTTTQNGAATTTVQTNPSESVTESGRSTLTTHNAGTVSVNSSDPAVSTSRTQTATTQSLRSQSSQEESSVAPNRVFQDLQTNMLTTQAQINGVQAKRDSLAATLDKGVAASASLPSASAELAHLQVQATAAATAYTNIRNVYELAILDRAQGNGEVSIVDRAAVPLYPDRPLRYLFALIGLLCGVVGGTGVGYWADSYQRRRTGALLVAGGPDRDHPLVPGPLKEPVFGTQAGTAQP